MLFTTCCGTQLEMNELFPGGMNDRFLPVCSVSCTVQLQLFTNNDIL